ncbi:MAG: 16S rRNA (adenine(1518)-N(6)/adenine(1519)-N(6))-dimethyltransferase RsmA [Oscillospiraceae bacterium]|nr:16S rRNA (adenine(1518)-N(6)/adenine(1519)-N(6))-dimethyltransferase RsmA [Oscillospiraceae bacterium]
MENKIANWSNLKEILKSHNFQFRKSLGQNFLIDKNILRQIVDASGVDANCAVLEIGAGAGVLTFEMATAAKKVVTVEIDRALIPILEHNLAGFDNVYIISDDILKVDINRLFEEHFAGLDVRVAANLPYYITTPIIMKLLESSLSGLKSLTVMVQKEVAARICAKPGGKDYGALSIAAQYHTKPSIVTDVSPHCFMPPPNVGSSVVHLEVLPNKSVAVRDEALFFALVRAAFGQRRKTLVNAIAGSSELQFEKEKVQAALLDMKKRPDVRGETFSVEDFAELSDKLAV